MALRSYSRITIHLLTLCFLLLPSIALSVDGASFAEQEAAGNFVPLVGIPFIEGDTVATFGDYVNAFYFAAISIAAFLAVVRIVFAGVKYMLSGVVTDKQVAKKDIRSALFGLLIVVGAVLILNTINTNLTNVSLFADAPVPGMTGDPGRVETNATPIDDERAACVAQGDDFDFNIITTVPEGGSTRDAVITTECCGPGMCDEALSAGPNSTETILIKEYSVATLQTLDTDQRQLQINLWRTDCEVTTAREVQAAARQEALENGQNPYDAIQAIAVAFIQEESPERYTCLQRAQ